MWHSPCKSRTGKNEFDSFYDTLRFAIIDLFVSIPARNKKKSFLVDNPIVELFWWSWMTYIFLVRKQKQKIVMQTLMWHSPCKSKTDKNEFGSFYVTLRLAVIDLSASILARKKKKKRVGEKIIALGRKSDCRALLMELDDRHFPCHRKTKVSTILASELYKPIHKLLMIPRFVRMRKAREKNDAHHAQARVVRDGDLTTYQSAGWD